VSKLDDLEKVLMDAVAKAAAYEGSALGTGDPIDQIPETVIELRHAGAALRWLG
jgi:hypothetical protein